MMKIANSTRRIRDLTTKPTKLRIQTKLSIQTSQTIQFLPNKFSFIHTDKKQAPGTSEILKKSCFRKKRLVPDNKTLALAYVNTNLKSLTIFEATE